MSFKFLFSLFLILILSLNAFAVLSFTPASKSFIKSDILKGQGLCDSDSVISVEAKTFDGKEIFTKEIECQNNSFSLNYNLTPLDPSGLWVLSFTDGVNEVERVITINFSRESQFYLVKFLSPANTDRYRKETIFVSVEITDSGVPVEGLDVFFWGVNGEKIQLEQTGNGVYIKEYEIPIDVELGEWDLTVVSSNKSNNVIGGESTLSLAIKQALIEINLIKPQVNNFEVGTSMNLIVFASYKGNKPLVEEKVFALIGDREIILNKTSINTYSGKLNIVPSDIGEKSLILTAIDGAGNIGNYSREIVVSKGAFYSIQELAPITLIILILVVVVYIGGKKFISAKFDKVSLEAEKERLNKEIKKLQDNYYNKGSITKEYFVEKSSKNEAKIVEINKKLLDFKK